MKLSHEKIVQLSHVLISAIQGLDEIEIFEEPNAIRQEIVKIVNELMHEEEGLEEKVRSQIASQKRTIPEGSAEWELLHRKYYLEALRKLGVVAPATSRN